MNRRDERNDILGFDEDIKILQEKLLRKDHLDTMFISIIGESGVGKSTLAMELYNKLPLDDDLEIKLNCFMEPDSWPEEVVQIMYNTLSTELEDSAEPGEDADRAVKLCGYFSDKRYMIFLGGITSIPMLNLLRTCLPLKDNKKGSSVVLVLDAENEEVALHANAMNVDGINGIYLVTHLDEKRSEELFRSKALKKEVVLLSGGEAAKNKYDQIVFGITGGHPLSIVLLAGLLRFKEQPLQWEAVLQQLMLPAGEVGGQRSGAAVQMGSDIQASMSPSTAMERIFWACFEDLPNDIKPCYLYFVTLGKNVIDAKLIVLMWIAEGFIKPRKGKTMEEVGHRYVKELALRGLIHIYSRDNVGGIWQVKVHSSLHGFLQSESREAGFAEVHDIHHVFVPPSARRLSFQIYGGRYTTFTKKLPKLRSIISLGRHDLPIDRRDSTGADKEIFDLKFLLGSKFLRVIVLTAQRITELPKDIGQLLELRCLFIGSQELKHLPSSIKKLLNLQTLSIGDTGVQSIDAGFWKIKTLRYVNASNLILPESLEEQLGELQTLGGVKPPQGQEWKVHNCPLHKMRKLRVLFLEGIQHEYHGAALESALKEMHLLVIVSLKGDLLPLCVFTAKNLRFLEEIQLGGKVNWPNGALNVRMLRPNLRLFGAEPYADVPDHIKREMSDF
jgi:hypothetical protein